MHKNRLEAFSDGVLAIIITIMVLELKAPHGVDLADLLPLGHTFLGYALSFIFVGIYWNNHHHLFQLVHKVNGPILWANLHLLFWLSLVPFATAWIGEHGYTTWPVVFYGLILLFSGAAYFILARLLMASHGKESHIAHALGSDTKGKISILVYSAGIALSFLSPLFGYFLYALVALMWLVPDQRIEKTIKAIEQEPKH